MFHASQVNVETLISDLSEFLNLMEFLMVIVVQGESREHSIELILSLNEQAQEDLQALIERSMNLQQQQNADTNSELSFQNRLHLNLSQRSFVPNSPRLAMINKLETRISEFDAEVEDYKARLAKKD